MLVNSDKYNNLNYNESKREELHSSLLHLVQENIARGDRVYFTNSEFTARVFAATGTFPVFNCKGSSFSETRLADFDRMEVEDLGGSVIIRLTATDYITITM